MIQIDMPMPKSCEECPFNSGCAECEGWSNICLASADCELNLGENYLTRTAKWCKEHGEKYIYTPYDHRHEKCPLIEVNDNDND